MTRATADRTTLAIALSLVALVLFDFMALVIKHLSPSFAAAELSAWRNVIGLIPAVIALYLTPTWRAAGKPMKLRQWPLAIFRGCAIAAAQLSFYLGLAKLAFATASTITYANALFMTALAVPILGEKVGLARWSAVLMGFAGVIWIMKPGGDTFTFDALYPLSAAFFYALAGATTRLFDEDIPTPLINLYTSFMAAIAAVIIALSAGGFQTPDTEALLWIGAMGLFGGCAVLCLIYAYRLTEQSNLAPFSYFGIPIAFGLGWLFFDEAPWNELFPGALLIIASGLVIVFRERRKAQKTATTQT